MALHSPADMEFQVFAYKRCRELARRMACFRGEHPAQRAEWPAGSAADLANVTLPVPADAPDIQYTEEDNNAIRGFVRKYCESSRRIVDLLQYSLYCVQPRMLCMPYVQ